MVSNPIAAILNFLFSNEEEAGEPQHREFAKADIASRIGDFGSNAGQIIDYYVKDFSTTKTGTDYKYVFEYESDEFGVGEVVLNPPEQGEGWSQLHAFMAHFGVTAVDSLDEMVGQELDLSLDGNGTVTAEWTDSGPGTKFVNTDEKAQSESNPVIEDTSDSQTTESDVEAEQEVPTSDASADD